ncbi:MAG: hypothetical protein KF779_10350 [Hyphomonadaceae bacterium]|nr:hypothetical protein [Hyphomonadaceae bacterium]
MCDERKAVPRLIERQNQKRTFIIAAIAMYLWSTCGPIANADTPAAPASVVQGCAMDAGDEGIVGPEGSDAPLWVKDGADVRCVQRDMRSAYPHIIQVWASADAPTPVITSGTDGRHMIGSRHAYGEALDLRLNNVSVAEGERLCLALRDALAALFPRQYDVVFEFDAEQPQRRHCHVEFDARVI